MPASCDARICHAIIWSGQDRIFTLIHTIILSILTGYEYLQHRYFGYQQVIHNHLIYLLKRTEQIIV